MFDKPTPLNREESFPVKPEEAEAAPAITNAAEESDTPLSEVQKREAEARLRALEEERRKHQLPGMRMGYLRLSRFIIFPYLCYQSYVNFAEGEWQHGILFAILAALATQLHRITLTPEQTTLAQELAQIEDVRSVGRLAEALEWPDAKTHKAAVKSLTSLLPQLKASDASLLNTAQRECLYQALNWATAKTNPNFVKAILQALEQVGDEAAVPFVERLAKSAPSTGMREAAQECLPFLRARVEQARISQQLLRASSEVSTPSHMLLRPAAGTTEADTNQLLRANTPEEQAHDK